MTIAALPSVDWIRLTIGEDRIDLAPSPGIQLRLIVEPAAEDRSFDSVYLPRSPALRVFVDLIPDASTAEPGINVVAACEGKAAQLAGQLGAEAPPLASLKEFSLEAALAGAGLPYNRVSVPRLTLTPFAPPVLDEDQPLPGVRVFTATARPDADGSQYVLTSRA